ncbi:mCG119240, partial [Mus musculus]
VLLLAARRTACYPHPRWVSGIPATTPRARPPSSASVKPPGPVNVALSTPWPARPAFAPAPPPCRSAANGVISGSPNTVCFSSLGSDWRGSLPRTRVALCSDSMALSALLPDLLCDVCIARKFAVTLEPRLRKRRWRKERQ